MRVTVLARGAQPNAICKDSLEPVKISPPDIDMLVDHDPRQVLARPLAHDARLAMMDFQTLFQSDGRNVEGKAQNTLCEIFIAGESEIVRISRVRGAGRFRQTGQTAI